MALTKAISTSNSARPSTDHAPEKGDPGKLGYTFVAYPTEHPATDNMEIAGLKDNFAFDDPQDGTSAGAYLHQEEVYNAETGSDDGAFESEEGEGEHFESEDKAEKSALRKGKND